MAGLHKSQFENPLLAWIDSRLPIPSMLYKEYAAFPTPKNFNYFWNFGALAVVTLVIMIATGIFLAMDYQPNTDLAFNSVQHIMRDVNYGWLIRYVHQNGASMFFIVTYIHILRGMYYGSYKAPRELLWILGVVILLIMMATAFMGYVLPWGQMSYWGATVITNLFSAFPLVGHGIVTWLWGGFSVDNPTLNRFFALHYLLPFILVAVVGLHVFALHITGSNNPLGIDVKARRTRCRSTRTTRSRTASASAPSWRSGRCSCSSRRTCWATPTTSSPPIRCKPRTTSCPNGTSCRSTRCCARCRTSWAACASCSARSWCCSSCRGWTPAGAQCPVPADLPAGDLAWVAATIVLGVVGSHQPIGIWVPIGRLLHAVLLLPFPGAAAIARRAGTATAAAGKHQPRGARPGRRRPAALGRHGQADGEGVMGPFRSLLRSLAAVCLLSDSCFPGRRWPRKSRRCPTRTGVSTACSAALTCGRAARLLGV